MNFKHYGEFIYKIRQDRNMTLKRLRVMPLLPIISVVLKKD